MEAFLLEGQQLVEERLIPAAAAAVGHDVDRPDSVPLMPINRG